MPLFISGATKTRVQANGTYMLRVESNGVVVFNLNSFWTFLGTSFTSVNVTFAGTYRYVSTSTATGFTLCSQQTNAAGLTGASQVLNSSFPTQNYGGGATAAIPTWEVQNRFGQVARCAIDFGYPPLRYQVNGTY